MMKDTPSKTFFSIVIPTLNEERFLPLLLRDLEKQTYSDFEVIVVDAHSKDKTREKAERFREKFKNLKIIDSPKKNVCFQRNFGAKNSLSDWLIFMDADNRIPPYFLQGIKFQLELYKPDILTTWIEPDTRNSKDKAISTLVNLYIELQKTTKKPSVLESLICIKKKAFERLKGFDEKRHWGEGGDLLERAVKARMKYCVAKNPRYKYSFRRLRKEGTLKLFRKFAELEINRLRNKKIAKEKAERLYPMDGGSYFLIDDKNKGNIEKIFSKLVKETKTQIKNGQETIFNKIIKNLIPKFLGKK